MGATVLICLGFAGIGMAVRSGAACAAFSGINGAGLGVCVASTESELSVGLGSGKEGAAETKVALMVSPELICPQRLSCSLLK